MRLDVTISDCHEVTVSIHALNEECDTDTGFWKEVNYVSIHALNEECDLSLQSVVVTKVSIHALNEECDSWIGC